MPARAFMAASLTLLCGLSRAATYYVATNGSNTNPGTSASPFLTLQRGVDAASAGDTILVADGTYVACQGGSVGGPDAVVINKAGTASAWITIRAQNKWGAILEGSKNCHSYFNLGSSGDYWIISGFEMRNMYWSAIWANNSGIANLQVRGNNIHDIGLDWNTNPTPGIVGIQVAQGATNVLIDGNVFWRIGRTGSSNGAVDHSIYTHGTASVISNNVFHTLVNGWHIQTAVGFGGMIANNTFFGPDPYLSQSGQIMVWDPQQDLTIRNNIFYNPTRNGIATYAATVSGPCSIDHNIVYNSGSSVGMISPAIPGCTETANLLNSDPKLTSPTLPNWDFQLLSGSPAINAGVPVAAVPNDYNGVVRPQGTAYDLGAFEYGGATPVAGDTTAPLISAVTVSAITQGGATVAWTTNEAADTVVEYGPTLSYGSSTPLSTALTTSHSAILSGLTAGALYHYRVKSKDAAGNLATSPDAMFTTSAFAPAGCVTSAATWQNAALASQTGTFSAEFDAVPGAGNIDGVSGLSNGPASDWSALAVIVRFNNAGTIDARNGGAYGAAAAIPYLGGLSYHFRLVVNVAAHTYNAYVKQGGGAEQLLASSYAFRTEQASVSTLNNLGLLASSGSEQVCAVTASAATSDTAPPVISSVSATGIGQNGATIGWATNEPADTQVEYGPSTAYGASSPLNSALTTGHGVALSALTAGTLYHYRVKSKDAAGNPAVSGDFTFTTASAADTAAPVITAVASSGVSQTGATIGWTTNEASDTQVEYGPTTAYGAATLLNSALVTSHGATLSGLTAGTVYHYRAKSKDAAGNLASSPDATFTTSAASVSPGCLSSAGTWQNASLAPQTGTFTAEYDAVPGAAGIDGVSGLSNGAAADYNALAAIVRFNTAGLIDARNGGAYAAAAAIPYVAGLTYHVRLAVNMTARTYSAYVRQGTGAEQLIGGNYAFRTEQAGATTLNNVGLLSSTGSEQVCGATAAGATADTTAPTISAVAASAVSQSGASIGWTTNEASDTQVEYGPTTAYGASTLLNTSLTTSHGAALSGLTAGTLYHYLAKSKDASGNLATSPDATFTTAAPAPASCVTSAGSWANVPLPSQSGTFGAEFDATPSAANIDGVSGLSFGAASDYAKLAAIVRFNTAGLIDARNAGAYTAGAAIPYVAGLTYHFRLVVSLTARKYSAYVKQGAGPELLIGGNYSFRTEQSGLTTINNLAVLSSVGSEKLCGAAVR